MGKGWVFGIGRVLGQLHPTGRAEAFDQISWKFPVRAESVRPNDNLHEEKYDHPHH